MAVMRVHKTTDYTVMSNFHLRDKRLTLKAKGLLSVILSLPEDWNYSISGLAAICAEGECAVKSALQELKVCGYLKIEKINPTADNGGRYEYAYHIYEQPDAKQEAEKQDTEKQEVEIQEVDFLPLENHPLNKNTKEVNKENKILKDINKKVSCGKNEKSKKTPKTECKSTRFIPPTVEEVKAYCDERQNNVDPQKFVDFYEAKGWLIGKSKMKNWKAAVRTWENTDKKSKKGDFIPDEIKKRLEKWSV